MDVLRLLALCCHDTGEQAMAEHYLAGLPELYFLKTEIAAAIRSGTAQQEEIEKTENVCLRILGTMLRMREERACSPEDKARIRELREAFLTLFCQAPEFRERAESIAETVQNGDVLSFYR